MEAVPAHDAGVGAHEEEQRQVVPEAFQGAREICPGEVKVEETSEHQGHEVDDHAVIICILIDKADVYENQHDIKGAEEAD